MFRQTNTVLPVFTYHFDATVVAVQLCIWKSYDEHGVMCARECLNIGTAACRVSVYEYTKLGWDQSALRTRIETIMTAVQLSVASLLAL